AIFCEAISIDLIQPINSTVHHSTRVGDKLAAVWAREPFTRERQKRVSPSIQTHRKQAYAKTFTREIYQPQTRRPLGRRIGAAVRRHFRYGRSRASGRLSGNL